MFQRLLDASGVGLRAMYLPGLQGLKQQLRMLEWLLERIMPALKDHLQVTRVPQAPGSTSSTTSVTGDAPNLYSNREAAPFRCRTCCCLLSAAEASAA